MIILETCGIQKNMRKTKKKSRDERIFKTYGTISIIIVNLIILVILANIFSGILIQIVKPHIKYGPMNYNKDLLEKAYPGMQYTDILDLLREQWLYAKGEYEPYTIFKPAPFVGKYYNIDVNGYRLIKNQCPWNNTDNNTYNIYIFGGSTTLGADVDDNSTIPSYMQEYLRNGTGKNICVYNFGRSHYFSTQERILFEKLLVEKNRPNAVVFIDGLNDFYYANSNPEFTPEFGEYVNARAFLHISKCTCP